LIQKVEDRRVRRTKKLLRQGLAELMNEKDFKDITVKEITQRVDLNRGTFYLHYRDTYDLLEKIEEELITTFELAVEEYRPTKENTSAFQIIHQFYDYMEENMEICTILFSNQTSSTYENKLLKIIVSKGFEIGETLATETNSKEMDYKSHFFACGLLGIVKKWIAEELVFSKNEMVEMTDNLISTTFQTLLLQK